MVEGSKKILTEDKLTIFLYMLMRDHLPAGIVESIVQDVEKIEDEARFCNGFLAEYAQQLTSRLKGKENFERHNNCKIKWTEDDVTPNPNIKAPKFRTVSEGYDSNVNKQKKEEPEIDMNLVIRTEPIMIKEHKSTPEKKKTKKIKHRYYIKLVTSFDKFEKKGWRIKKTPYIELDKWVAILEK